MNLFDDEIMAILPGHLRSFVINNAPDPDKLQEIRLRKGRKAAIMYAGHIRSGIDASCVVTEEDFAKVLSKVSRYSLYAFEDEVKNGYLTIPGGHRVGMLGRAVMDKGQVKSMRHISTLNIRISRAKKGCADDLIKHVVKNDIFLSTLIISPPGGGKTTMLRDMVRQLAGGGWHMTGYNVSLIDERSEVAACYQGVPQHDIGPYCDVADALPKVVGIRMAIRSMAPDIVAVDEVGTDEDIEAMYEARISGCALLATAHGDSIGQICDAMPKTLFERYVMLGDRWSPGTCIAISDGKGELLCGSG